MLIAYVITVLIILFDLIVIVKYFKSVSKREKLREKNLRNIKNIVCELSSSYRTKTNDNLFCEAKMTDCGYLNSYLDIEIIDYTKNVPWFLRNV